MLFPNNQNWRAGMQEASDAIDDTMGELVTVTPAVSDKPNFPRIVDRAREATATAVFTDRAKTVIMGSEGRIGGHSISPLVTTDEPIFSFSYGALPFDILQGYRITRHCNGETFEAKDVRPDGVSRVVVPVSRLGRSGSYR